MLDRIYFKFHQPASKATKTLILDAVFDKKQREIKITKSILQYVNKLDVLCLPKDTKRADADNTYQLTVEYGSLGITKMIANRFGLNCVQDGGDCLGSLRTISDDMHNLWSQGDCLGIKNQKGGKDLCIYCVPHFFNPSTSESGKHTFFNLNKSCHGSDDDLKLFVDAKLRKPKVISDLKLADQDYLDKWSKEVGYMPELRDDFKNSDDSSKSENGSIQ
ncbi:uncharacterized protein LOC142348109 [Convolutriloba macropyga]|uniref:uncharacterized protein LOC142348109 n=1 Tax=Convolutriloba macropyga TaxID=536237 RepID=UPI003F522AB4